MSLKLYNTLSRKKEPFKPLRGKTVNFYSCGPTVYDTAHIGNLRKYVFDDTLRRWLKYGHVYKVRQVMNITDVEDKIIAAANAKTLADVRDYTKPHESKFFEDLRALGIESAESYPKATAHVGGMIKLIEQVIKNSLAYERGGSVYLDVAAYNQRYGYGALQKVDVGKDTAKHRIDNDEYDKDHIQDFALWKAEPEDAPGWESPWGHGRPGWHIECSAMIAAEHKDLPIDLHTGAVDNIFPHHENEIAQTKGATGKDLARFWLHSEWLLVEGKKMAKSEGNYVTLAEVMKRGFRPVHLRMLYLQAHYRSKINFTWESLAAAKESYERLQAFYDRVAKSPDPKREDPQAVATLIEEAKGRFSTAMGDDLNTAEALAVVFDFVRDGNALIDSGELDEGDWGPVLDILKSWNQILGVLTLRASAPPTAVKKLSAEREKARGQDDFNAADKLRKQIEAKGWQVEDTAEGPRLREL